MKTPDEIVGMMLSGDTYSKALGMQLEFLEAGNCVLRMKVVEHMVNGFNIAHGGITYALADSAMAFASNAHGVQCVSIETAISHIKKVQVGDDLRASCSTLSRNRKAGIYEVKVTNQSEELVAHFKGTVLISDRAW
jgi:acyl-CoA thioesterase